MDSAGSSFIGSASSSSSPVDLIPREKLILSEGPIRLGSADLVFFTMIRPSRVQKLSILPPLSRGSNVWITEWFMDVKSSVMKVNWGAFLSFFF